MATAQVFNGNVDQAFLVVKKQLQRDRTALKKRNGVAHIPRSIKLMMKERENTRRHARKKRAALRNDPTYSYKLSYKSSGGKR